MRWGTLRRTVGALAAAVIVAVDVSPAGRHLLRLPSAVTLAVGQEQGLTLGIPGPVAVASNARRSALLVDGRALGPGWTDLPGGVLRLQPEAPGTYLLHLRPLGVLPWPTLRLDAVSMPRVVAGGQSVGLVLQLRGALIVREEPVGSLPHARPSPAAAAGVRVGDYLLALDGRPVQSAAQVSGVLTRVGGQPVRAEVLEGGRIRRVTIRPVYSPSQRGYSLGARLQGVVSGIGTLTFYDAGARVFGALGHVVVDEGTGQPVLSSSGQLLSSLVAGLEPSRDGAPGQKLGVLLGGAPLGVVQRNTSVGVFGHLLHMPPPGALAAPLPVALADQVRPGPAKLLTVVHGGAVEAFAVRILSVDPGGPRGGRGVVVQVVDPRLLRASGGIVQGMSGSPLIQDGRLVGALTHLFVNDPTRGYGVLAQWMALAAGLGVPPDGSGSGAATPAGRGG